MKNFFIFIAVVFLLVGCGSKNESRSSQSSPQLGASTLVGSSQGSLVKQGVQFLNQKDFSRAIMAFNQAVKQNPNDPEPHFILGEVYMRTNNIKGAIASFENVVRVQPDNGQAFYLLGLCYGLAGDQETAQKAIERSAVIFQQKRDEEDFKRALLTLQQMKAVDEKSVSSTAAGRPILNNQLQDLEKGSRRK